MPARRLHAFPKAARLNCSADYEQVFRQPLKLNHPAFTLLARSNGLRKGARLGLVVSKRNLARAVDRQRVKRLVRESFRQTRPALPDCDVIILARAGIARMDNAQLLQALTEKWRTLARLCERSSSAASSSTVTL